jgi:hypothetical protein
MTKKELQELWTRYIQGEPISMDETDQLRELTDYVRNTANPLMVFPGCECASNYLWQHYHNLVSMLRARENR